MEQRKRSLILDGHPGQDSMSRSLAETYEAAARRAGHETRIVHLNALTFDPDFEYGSYREIKPLEPELEAFMQDLEWSEHFVLVTPMWWGGVPAKLKGLFDRAFLPGRAFDTRNTNRFGMPSPMLGGRSARVIISSDTPTFFMRLAYRNALLHQLRGQILGFIGLKPVRFTKLAQASHPKSGQVAKWQAKIADLGAAAA